MNFLVTRFGPLWFLIFLFNISWLFVISTPPNAFAIPISINIGPVQENTVIECEFSSDPSFSTVLAKEKVVGHTFHWNSPTEGVYHWRLTQNKLNTNVISPIASGSVVAIDSLPPNTEKEIVQITWQSTTGAAKFNIKITESTGRVKNLLTPSSLLMISRASVPQVIEIIPHGRSEETWSCCFEPNLTLIRKNDVPDRTALTSIMTGSVSPGLTSPTSGTGVSSDTILVEKDPGAPILDLNLKEQGPPESDPNAPGTVDEKPTMTSVSPPLNLAEPKLQEKEDLKESTTSTPPAAAPTQAAAPSSPAATPAPTETPTAATVPTEPQKSSDDIKRRKLLFQVFGTYESENYHAQKLEIDLSSEEGFGGFGASLFTNPIAGFIFESNWDYHEHKASMSQEKSFGAHKIEFRKARYTWDFSVGYDLLSFFNLPSHLLAVKAAGALTQFPTLPLMYMASQDNLPKFDKKNEFLYGGMAEYGFFLTGAKGFGIVAETGYFVSANDSDLALNRAWIEYYLIKNLSLSLGGFSRTLSTKECHENSLTCLTEGKVHTTISEIGGYLGTGYVFQ